MALFVLLIVAFKPPGASCDPPASAGATAQTILAYTVPYTPAVGNDAPLVSVRINDKVDATFLVDTGTNLSRVSEKLVAKLGLTIQAAKKADGIPVTTYGKPDHYTTLTSLRIGASSLRDPFNAMLLQPLNGSFFVFSEQQLYDTAHQPIDGIIGADLLSQFAVNFDLQKRQMTFYTPGGLTRELWQSAGVVSPAATDLRLSMPGSDWAFWVPAQLSDGKTSRQTSLLVDIGFPITVIPRDIADALSLHPAQHGTAAGAFGSVALDRARVPTFALGDLRLSDFLVSYPDKGTAPTVLGLDVLSGYQVLMDFPAKRMYLSPLSPLVPVKPAAPTATVLPVAPAPVTP